MKKKLLLLLVCSMTAVCGFAQTSGTCGANLTWTLSGSLLTISGNGAMAAYSTTFASPWYSHRTSISKVVIEEGVTSIGGYAFYDCRSLTSVTIPNSVTSIEWDAFYWCVSLTSITIPNSVTSIQSYTFYDCSSLTSVTISNSVTYIGSHAFDACSSLTSVTIPDGVTSIGDYAFCDCSKITSLTIPNSVTSIGNSAFYFCSRLTSVTIPDNVTSIGNDAFHGCSRLTTVNFNAINCTYMGTSGLGYSVFQNDAFTTLNIGDQVKTIPNKAFYNCSTLSTINCLCSVPPEVGTNAFFGVITSNCRVSVPSPNDISVYLSTNIWDGFSYIFNMDPLSYALSISENNKYAAVVSLASDYTGSFEIPSTITCNGDIYDVTGIAASAFLGRTGLTSVIIPNSVISIGSNAFTNCSLQEVTTPIASTEFPSQLQKLIVKDVCTNIPAGVFSTYTNLQELSLPFIGTSPTNPGALSSLFGSSGVPATLQKLTLVHSANNIQIADRALYGLSQLTEVTISSNVRGLGTEAMAGCNNLQHLYSQWAYPPTAYANSTFNQINKFMCILHVPVGSKDDYSSPQAVGWNEWLPGNIQEEASVIITALPVPLSGGVINGDLQYNYDATADITAQGNMGYNFQGWMENDQIVSTNREYTFTVEGPRTLYAIFTPRENADENIQIQAQARSASISWVAVEDAANYSLVIYSDESRTEEIARFQLDANGNVLRNATRALSCTVPDLDTNTQYYYSLTSYDANNQALTISAGDFTTSASNAINNITVSDPVVAIQYYDFIGRVMTQPQQGHAYIVKEVHQSGKVDVRKEVY